MLLGVSRFFVQWETDGFHLSANIHNCCISSVSFPSSTAGNIYHMEGENSWFFSKTQTLMMQCKLSKCATSFGIGLAPFLKNSK